MFAGAVTQTVLGKLLAKQINVGKECLVRYMPRLLLWVNIKSNTSQFCWQYFMQLVCCFSTCQHIAYMLSALYPIARPSVTRVDQSKRLAPSL